MTNVASGREFFNLSPSEYSILLHGDARGTIAFVAFSKRRWNEYPVCCPKELADTINRYVRFAKERGLHLYLTPTRFKGVRRATAEIAVLTALWLDLDLYKAVDPVARSLSEKIQAGYPEAALEVLRYVEVPLPTLVIASGRGAYFIWLIRPAVRPSAQPLVIGMGKALVAKFRNWGADAKVTTDLKRVLRVPGSINWKSSQPVIAFHIGPTYELHQLVGELGDYFEDAEEYWKWFNLKRKKEGKRLDLRPIHPSRAGAGLLWRNRLEDIVRLIELRWFGVPEEGWRDKSLFLIGVALSWLLPADRGIVEAEVRKYAKMLIPYKYQEFMPYMKSLLDRVQATAENPEKEMRYRFKAETIAEWLEVTEEEALQLPNLSIPPVGVSLAEWKNVRVAEALKRLRRVTVRETRRQKYGWKKEKTSKAVEERMAKLLVALQERPKSTEELADNLGVSVRTIWRYVARLRERGYNIQAVNNPVRGRKGAGEWVYMYIPTVEIA